MPASLITSRANPRVKQLRAAFAGNARLADGLVAIEGENLVREAVRSGIALHTVFLSERTPVPSWLPRNIETLHSADAIFASAVDTQSPQGIAALIEPPQWSLEAIGYNSQRAPETGAASKPRKHEESLKAFAMRVAPPLFLIAAGLQDPGNLGTLIRSAEAFAATAVLTTSGTVSPWNQKALRASAGSVFRVPVIPITTADLAQLKSRGIRLLAAVAPESDSNTHRNGAHVPTILPATDADLTQPAALMIGNEGSGLSSDLLALADARISIPTPGPVESLNAAVAGSLLLYESTRQRESARQRKTTLLASEIPGT